MSASEWLKLNRCPWCKYSKRKECGCKVGKTYDGCRCYGYRCDEERKVSE